MTEQHPVTIEDEIAGSAYPLPLTGEDATSFIRRIALIGAHQGMAWQMTHGAPAVVRLPEPATLERLALYGSTIDAVRGVLDAREVGASNALLDLIANVRVVLAGLDTPGETGE